MFRLGSNRARQNRGGSLIRRAYLGITKIFSNSAEPLFDTIASFSLRKIDGYGGEIYNVRRENDDDERTFTYDELSNGSYIDWVGENSVFAQRLYSQKNNITLNASADSEEPRAFSSGSLDTDSNGNYQLNFDGSNDQVETTNTNLLSIVNGSNPQYSIIIVIEGTALNNEYVFDFRDSGNSNDIVAFFIRSSGHFRFITRDSAGTVGYDNNTIGTYAINTQYIIEIYNDGSNLNIWINGTQEVTNASITSMTTRAIDTFSLGEDIPGGGSGFDGSIKEFHIWDSDVSSRRELYYNNINNYYNPTKPNHVWGLKSTNGYNREVIKVREDSGDTEQRITPTGITDGTLTTHTSTNSGYIERFYDHIGDVDLTAPADSNESKIVDSGTLETDSNGNPIAVFDGVNDTYSSTDSSILNIKSGTNSPSSIIIVCEFNAFNTGTNQVLFEFVDLGNTSDLQRLQYNNSTNQFRIFGRDSGGTIRLDEKFGTPATNTQYIFECYYSSTDVVVYLNNVEVVNTSITSGTYAPDTFTLFNNGSGVNKVNGDFKEIQLYDTDKSSERTTIYNELTERWSPTPNHAWSLKGYSGRLINVRESGGDKEYQFNSSEIIDGKLTRFTSNNSGFIERFYDVGSGSADLIASADSNESRIVNSGTLETDSNGNSVAVFDGINDGLISTDSNLLNIFSSTEPEFSVIMVFELNDDTSTQPLWVAQDSGNTTDAQVLQYRSTNELRVLLRDSSGTVRKSIDFGTITAGNQYIVEVYVGSTLNVWVNGTQEVTNSALTTSVSQSPDRFVTMRNYNNSGNLDGNFKHLEIYDSDKSSERITIYNNLNNKWS